MWKTRKGIVSNGELRSREKVLGRLNQRKPGERRNQEKLLDRLSRRKHAARQSREKRLVRRKQDRRRLSKRKNVAQRGVKNAANARNLDR
jgi:hypothetical protein